MSVLGSRSRDNVIVEGVLIACERAMLDVFVSLRADVSSAREVTTPPFAKLNPGERYNLEEFPV
jgi:hypothetical protein